MRLPGAEEAWIPKGKVAEYLLSETHPTGSSKARFFRAMGFTIDDVEGFGRALLELVSTEDVAEAVRTRYGSKYTVEGYLVGPAGERGQVRTVWIVEPDGKGPRLVTAYPV